MPKSNEPKDTSQSYILKLADLLDDKKQKIANNSSNNYIIANKDQNNSNNELLKIIEESIHDDINLINSEENKDNLNEEHEKSKNFLPSIHNLSAIKPIDKSTNKKKPIYELNRQENNLQNELKLINREKMDHIHKIEKKYHIKMAMVKSSDIIKKNYQNLYDEPYQIEVIDEEDLENSLDNINYILNKKVKNTKKFSPNGPHIYIFPHVSKINYTENGNESQQNSVFDNNNYILNSSKINRTNIFLNQTNNKINNNDKNQNLPAETSNENNNKNIEGHIIEEHKNDLISNKTNCEVIKELPSEQSTTKQELKQKKTEENYEKNYNELVSYRKNIKEKVVSEHQKIRSSIDKRKKKKKKNFNLFKIEKNEGNLQDISRISRQNQGKINIIHAENYKKVLKEMIL